MPEPSLLTRLFIAGRRRLAVAAIVATLLAVVGLSRLEYSDDYREIFRSDTPEYALLDEISEQFGADEQQIFVLVESPDLFTEAGVDGLRRLGEALERTTGVERVESPLALSGLPGLLAASDDPAERDRIAAAIRGHPMLGGRLVSEGLDAVLVVVQIDDRLRTLARVEPLLARLDEAVAAILEGETEGGSTPHVSTPRVSVTGLAFFRAEIVRAVQRDQIVFTGVGLLLGALVALAVFRHPAPVVAFAVGPMVGTLWTMGALGWMGQPIDVLNNVVPVLVLVIGMTDSVHLVRAFQQGRSEGLSRDQASLRSIRSVGAACALTSLTTVVGFSSLALAEVESVRRFGLACALGLALSFVAVMVLVPVLTAGRLGKWIPARGSALPVRRLAALGLDHPRLVSVLGLALLALCAAAFPRLAPDYQYREFLPDESRSLGALERIESAFGGAFPLHAVVSWEEPTPPVVVMEALHRVDSVMRDVPQATLPFSVLNPLHAILGTEHAPSDDVEVSPMVPEHVRRRFYRPEARRAMVSVGMKELGAAELETVFSDLEKRLAAIAAEQEGLELRLSGLLYVAGVSSLRMIGSLFKSLLLAAPIIILLLAWGLRSVRLGLLSIAPNLLPMSAIAAYLVLTGRPLQFTTVTLFTLSLAIAVDDTIHMLVHFRRRRRSGQALEPALRDTLTTVGPSLITTSALLVAGFAAVGLSRAPLMSLFGWLGSLAILVALAADLLLLPALIATFGDGEPRD